MKALIFVLCLFAALISGIFLNAAYTAKTSATLLEMTEALPSPTFDSCESSVSELRKVWDSSKTILKLSVDLNRTDEIEDMINSLYIHARYRNEQEFERIRLILKSRFSELSRFENLDPLN